VPFAPIDVPVPLPVAGPFAALCVDAPRRRVFAAGARSVAVIDADTGKLLATIRIAAPISLAVEPLGGHVFAGGADGRISEIDPDRKAVVRSLDAGGEVDVLLYDSTSGRLYADGAARTALATFDARAFAAGAAVPLAGVPAALAPDPVTRELYVEFADRPQIAIVDPARAAARTGFPISGVLGSDVMRFDDALGQIVVAGRNGVLDIYDRAGTRRARVAVPAGIAACDLDPGDHVLACTGPAELTFVQLQREAAPQIIGSTALPGPALAALDAKTHDALVLSSNPDGSGAAVERFSASPPVPSPSPSAR